MDIASNSYLAAHPAELSTAEAAGSEWGPYKMHAESARDFLHNMAPKMSAVT